MKIFAAKLRCDTVKKKASIWKENFQPLKGGFILQWLFLVPLIGGPIGSIYDLYIAFWGGYMLPETIFSK